jgi:hypothetical protein
MSDNCPIILHLVSERLVENAFERSQYLRLIFKKELVKKTSVILIRKQEFYFKSVIGLWFGLTPIKVYDLILFLLQTFKLFLFHLLNYLKFSREKCFLQIVFCFETNFVLIKVFVK